MEPGVCHNEIFALLNVTHFANNCDKVIVTVKHKHTEACVLTFKYYAVNLTLEGL